MSEKSILPMQILKFDEFVRSLKQNKDIFHSFLLGAGASVESGIPSASDCIWDWKHEIFISQNPSLVTSFNNVKTDHVKNGIQIWLDNQGTYPKQNADEEYAFYAEQALPIEEDRRKYFQHLTENKKPSLGYHLLSMLAETEWIKSVWTTNFDGLILKTAHQYDLTPIEVTLESQERIHRGAAKNELLCVALHGDYKYGALKNSATELDSQSSILTDALKYELTTRNFIVIGYSGRDKSLMTAIKEAYKQPGAGRLYWCGYGANCPPAVEELLNAINSSGRYAFYIPTDGFDRTMLFISTHCMSTDSGFLSRLDTLKNSLGTEIDLKPSAFQSAQGNRVKIVKTNIYPVTFPSSCYQFRYSLLPEEKPWDYCKLLAKNDIIAVPYKDFLYIWGNKQSILQICSNKIKGELTTIPFSQQMVNRNGTFTEMLLRTLTTILGKKNNFGFSKDRIWDINKLFSFNIDNKQIYAYSGIQLSLLFDENRTYLSFAPSYRFRDSEKYAKEVVKQFSDNYYKKVNNIKTNLNINNYVDEWVRNLIGDSKFSIQYPIGSQEGFVFHFGSNSALVGINKQTQSYDLKLPNSIDQRRIIFNGIESHDPELIFYDSNQNKMASDFHPMRGLTQNYPFDYSFNSKILKPSINIGVICPKNHTTEFYSFLQQLNNQHPVNFNVDYVLSFPGFFNAFKIGLNLPIFDSPNWVEIQPPTKADLKKTSIEFGQLINQKLDQFSSSQTDVVLIYIPKEYEYFTSYSDDTENYDLHNLVKAFSVQKSISTQFIRERTLESDMRCQIMWSLSLAIYVKSCRIPWVISGLQKETAFAGLGYSINNSNNGTNVIIGCSHIYSADGQGLKYKLAKLNDVTFDRKKNPYLSEDEAYKLGLNIKELFYKSFTEIPKRVVIHKRTPFRNEEINGIVKSLSSSGITNIDLLEINFEENFRCFEMTRNFEIDGFPVRRGLCFPINEKSMLLYTHGIAPSVRNPSFKYIQGGKTIPLPLKVVKHYGNGNVAQIASEILGLSKMNWNSFELYSKLPCTIQSSNEIARIGWLLPHYEGCIYDYRFFM